MRSITPTPLCGSQAPAPSSRARAWLCYTIISTLALGWPYVGQSAVPTFDFGSGNTPAYQITQSENVTAIIASGDVINTDGTGIDEVKVNGGNDAGKFTLTYVDDASSFQLDFANAPDFDSPSDSNADNTYEIILKATDKDGESATVTYTVVITDINEAPTFSSTAAISRLEKTTSNASDVSALTVTAVDPEGATTTYSLSGGNDMALFDIDSSTGELTFKEPPDYDAPNDNGTNNVYDVQVQASDTLTTATQDIAITIVNVNEAPSITQPSTTAFSVQENWTDPVTYVDFLDPDFETVAGGDITYQITGDDQAFST